MRVIAVLAMYRDDDMIAAAVQAGVSGYVLKDARGLDLWQAIRTVAAGGAAVDPMVTSRVLEQYRRLSAMDDVLAVGFLTEARDGNPATAGRGRQQPDHRREDVPVGAERQEHPVRDLPEAGRRQPDRGRSHRAVQRADQGGGIMSAYVGCDPLADASHTPCVSGPR